MIKIQDFVLWNQLKITTGILYIIFLLLLVISPFYAAILLFSIICMWSRIPCMISDFTKDMDIIDFFSVLIAINVGGAFAGVFGMINLVLPRIFGPREYILYTIKDGICFFLCGLLTPFWYYVTDGNLLITMYMFTAMRYTFYILLTLVIDPSQIGLETFMCAAGIPVAYVTNTIYVTFFGKSLDNIFKKGLSVSWELFAFVTAVIIGYMVLSKYLEEYEKKKQDKLEKAKLDPTHVPEEIVEEFHKEKFQDDTILPEPHEILISLFETKGIAGIIKGTLKEFKVKSLIMLIICFAAKFYFSAYIPSIAEIILTIIMAYLSIDLLIRLIRWINKCSIKNLFRSLGIVIASFMILVIMIGVI